jgi:WhiB family redox-sensing transcriptional regulator
MEAQLSWNAGSGSFLSWRAAAACRTADSSVFFSADGERDRERYVRERRTKAICAACPVMLPCRAYALGHHEPHGVWGGLSERDRARIWAAESGAPPTGLGRLTAAGPGPAGPGRSA